MPVDVSTQNAVISEHFVMIVQNRSIIWCQGLRLAVVRFWEERWRKPLSTTIDTASLGEPLLRPIGPPQVLPPPPEPLAGTSWASFTEALGTGLDWAIDGGSRC